MSEDTKVEVGNERRERAKCLVEHASRWAMNILTELLGNHQQYLGECTRDTLKEVVRLLSQLV
jgi:hypothetical protein